MAMIYNVENAEIYEKSLSFFLDIYNAKDNELDDISSRFQEQQDRLATYEQNALSVLDGQSEGDLSRENYELRKRLENSERFVERMRADSSSSGNTR